MEMLVAFVAGVFATLFVALLREFLDLKRRVEDLEATIAGYEEIEDGPDGGQKVAPDLKIVKTDKVA